MTTALAIRQAATPWNVASPRTRALLALLVATAIWGTSFIAAKSVLGGIPPITLAWLRFAVALLVLLPLLARTGRRPVWGRQSALLGLTGVALLFVCQNVGLRLTGAADACLIMSGGFPVLVALLARALLGERLHRRVLAGLLASVPGIGLIVIVAGTSVGSSLAGDLLLLASTASAAAYAVLGRRAFAEHDLIAVLAGSTAFGLLFLSPFAVGEIALVGLTVPSAGDLLLLIYLGVGCSGLAYLLGGYGLRHLSAAETAVIGNLEVAIGLAAAAVCLHEPLTAAQLGGDALILGGVWLAAGGPADAAPADAGLAAARRSFRPCALLRKYTLAPRAS